VADEKEASDFADKFLAGFASLVDANFDELSKIWQTIPPDPGVARINEHLMEELEAKEREEHDQD
jgi:hypothetical protein